MLELSGFNSNILKGYTVTLKCYNNIPFGLPAINTIGIAIAVAGDL